MKRVLIVFLLISSFHTISAGDELISLLPDISDCKLLNTIQEPTVYVDFDLFTMIDGGAEIYFEYGFEKALSVAYLIQNTERLEIQIYKMNDAGAAFGIFSHSKIKSDSITVNDLSLSISSDYYQMVQRGKYYFVLSWSKPSREIAIMAGKLAGEIAENIKNPEHLPDLVADYIKEGYSLRQMKYIRGTIALSSAYFFSHKDIFDIGEAIFIEEDTRKLLFFTYTDELIASTQFISVQNEYSESERIINFEKGLNNFSFSDKRGRKILIGLEKNIIAVTITPGNTEGKSDKPNVEF